MTKTTADLFRGLERSLQFDRPGESPWRFPTRHDYLRHLISQGRIGSDADLVGEPELVAEIQRHWHGFAQHGCRFAQLLSRIPPAARWQNIVIAADETSLGSQCDELAERLETVASADDAHAVSILLPSITSVDALVSCLLIFRDQLRWQLQLDGAETGMDAGIQVRIPIVDGSVMSWAIGFAPLECLPFTRRAPITEIVFSLKPKPLPARSPRLNADPSTAHIADLPVPIDDVTFENFWNDSHNARLLLTSGFNPALARARVTYCLPLSPEQRASFTSVP